MQGLFNQLAGVRSNTGGLYFAQGNYEVMILANKLFTAGDNVPTFVTETQVISSDNPERPPGCQPSQVTKIKPGNMINTYLGNVKAYVGALMGVAAPDGYVPPEYAQLQGDQLVQYLNAWWEQCILWAANEEHNPYKGYILQLNCQDQAKKKSEGVFTKFNWGQIISTPVSRGEVQA